MPLPLASLIAGSAAGSAIGGTLSPIFGPLASFMSNAMLPAKYNANIGLGTLMPDPGPMIDAWLQNLINDQQFAQGLSIHNIPFRRGEGDSWQKKCSEWWERVIYSKIPLLSLEQLCVAYYSGLITENQFSDLSKSHRMRPGHTQPLYDLLYGKFTQESIFALHYRGRWKEPETIKRVRRLFGVGEDHAKDILYSTKFIPPPSDLIRMMVKDAFNRDPAITDPLDAEFDENPDAVHWFRAQGIEPITIEGSDGKPYTIDPAKYYWRAHWDLPSPTQAYEMLHRLRPDRIGRYPNPGGDLTPFVESDLRQLLKQADYAKKYRPWMQAISYAVPRLIDVRSMYEEEVIDLPEVKEKLQDRGYSPADADEVARFWELRKKDKEDKEKEKEYAKAYNKLRAAIYQAYKTGSITRDGALNALLMTDMDVEEANMILNAIDVEVNTGKVKQLVEMTKSAFFLGGVDPFDAFNTLLQAGVNNVRAADYIQVWQRRMTLPRKSLSAEKIITYVSDGRLDAQEAQRRLQNLGYPEQDQLLMLDVALDRAAEKRLQIEARLAKTEEQAKRAAERMQERQMANARRQVKEYAAIVTLPRLEKWYALGLVDKGYVLRTLLYVGWPQLEAQLAIDSLPERKTPNG